MRVLQRAGPMADGPDQRVSWTWKKSQDWLSSALPIPDLHSLSATDRFLVGPSEVRGDPSVLRPSPPRSAPVAAPVSADPPLNVILPTAARGIAVSGGPLGTPDAYDPDSGVRQTRTRQPVPGTPVGVLSVLDRKRLLHEPPSMH